jgi:hypothetical protein
VSSSEQLTRSKRTRDDDPVVAADVDLLRPDRLELDQRTTDYLELERFDPSGERLELLARAGHDHSQALRSGSHP